MRTGGAVTRARWYLDRLRSMPAAEIPHRIREASRKRLDAGGRFARRMGVAPPAARHLPVPQFPVDRLALASVDAPERARIAAQAAQVREGPLELLGERWPAGARTDWSLDPASGRHWRNDRFCFQVGRRHDDGAGDVKLPWELSRLQHLQLLALDACLNANEASRTACLEDLGRWIADNPPYLGLAYASGIELSARVVSTLVVAGLLGPDAFPKALAERVWDMLQAHGAWLARYPSLYSSANNHLLAEAVGLYLIGSLAPALPDAARWRDWGQRCIEREAALQVLPDGAGAEQSPTYLASTLEWLLVARHVARMLGLPLDPVVERRLVNGGKFLVAILDTAGAHPRFGDDDEGCLLRVALDPCPMPLAISGAIGAVLGEPAACHPAWRLDLRARLLGADCAPGPAARPGSGTFPDGGYTVLRQGPLLAMIDHGPLGYAYTAGHGHADALAVWLHAGARPVLVDAGTFRYNHDQGWRAWVRSAMSHNTLTVDGVDPSVQAGPFNWARRATARMLSADLGAAAPSVTATHDGYEALGVHHQRTLRLDGQAVEIRDRIDGSGRRLLRASFQFAPDLRLESGSHGWRVHAPEGPLASVSVDGSGLACRVALQSAVPPDGLRPGPGAISTRYNRLVPAPTLIIEGLVELPASIDIRITFDALNG